MLASGFEIHNLFSHVVWMGDMNWKLEKSIKPDDAIEKIRAGQLEELDKFDTLTQALKSGGSAFDQYKEPIKAMAGPGHFWPTYKKIPYREPVADYSDPAWVDGEYRILYKEPAYKGGKKKPRVPAWCDRILYRSAKGLQGGLAVEQIDLGGEIGMTDNYQVVNDSMLCSDHSPVHATFLLTTEAEAWAQLGAESASTTFDSSDEARECMIHLEGVRICDKSGRWNIGADGNWEDAESAEVCNPHDNPHRRLT